MFLSRVSLKPDIGAYTQLGALLRERTYGSHRLLWDLFAQPRRDFLYREEIAKEQINHPGIAGEPIYYLLSPQQPKTETPLFQVTSKPFNPEFFAGQHLSFRLRANPTVMRQQQRHDLVMDAQLGLYRQLCEDLGLPQTGSKMELLTRLRSPAQAAALVPWLTDYLSTTRYAAEVQQCHKVEAPLKLAVQEAVSRRLIAWLIDNPSRKGIFSLATHQLDDEGAVESGPVPLFEWQGYRGHPLPEKQPQARFFSVDMSGELIVNDPDRFWLLLQQGIGSAKGFGCGLMLVKPVWSV